MCKKIAHRVSENFGFNAQSRLLCNLCHTTETENNPEIRSCTFYNQNSYTYIMNSKLSQVVANGPYQVIYNQNYILVVPKRITAVTKKRPY